MEDVFKYIRENSEREFLLRVSYLEIYNESIRDLLSPEAIDLRIHEDRKVRITAWESSTIIGGRRANHLWFFVMLSAVFMLVRSRKRLSPRQVRL